MAQKIVVKICMTDEKMRIEAIKIAAGVGGTINSVTIAGENRDQLVVVGVGVDSVKLMTQLRKHMGCSCSLTMKGLCRRRPVLVQLVSVAPVEKKEEKEEKKEEKEDKEPPRPPPCHCSAVPCYLLYEFPEPSYNICHIL